MTRSLQRTMTSRPKITPQAQEITRRAHAAAAREISRRTPHSTGDVKEYLEIGADAGLTIAETLSVMERAAAKNRRPSEELAARYPARKAREVVQYDGEEPDHA